MNAARSAGPPAPEPSVRPQADNRATLHHGLGQGRAQQEHGKVADSAQSATGSSAPFPAAVTERKQSPAAVRVFRLSQHGNRASGTPVKYEDPNDGSCADHGSATLECDEEFQQISTGAHYFAHRNVGSGKCLSVSWTSWTAQRHSTRVPIGRP